MPQTVVQFRYDALGRRIEKQVHYVSRNRSWHPVVPLPASYRVRFIWDGLRLVQEIRRDGSTTYVYSDTDSYAPLARIDTPDGAREYTRVYWYHTRPDGTPEQLSDSNGEEVWRIVNDAWGRVDTAWGEINSAAVREDNLRMQGQYLDRETGLHYNLFRYYDADSMHFISPDPIGLAGGLNLYAYAPDPLNWADPLGLMNCGIKYGELDSLGRPTGVQARLNASHINTGTDANTNIQPLGFITGAGSNRARGHLLGRQLGGSGDDVRNLITIQQRPANTPVMSGVEGRIRKALERGEVVDLNVTPIYHGPSRIPAGVTIKAEGSGGFFEHVTVLNPPGM